MLAGAIGAVLSLAGGCTTYYKVSDPTTGKAYYTTELSEKNGSTQLLDAKTGNRVTIQNSEVAKVTKEEFETARSQK
jgi:hypothetical protein